MPVPSRRSPEKKPKTPRVSTGSLIVKGGKGLPPPSNMGQEVAPSPILGPIRSSSSSLTQSRDLGSISRSVEGAVKLQKRGSKQPGSRVHQYAAAVDYQQHPGLAQVERDFSNRGSSTTLLSSSEYSGSMGSRHPIEEQFPEDDSTKSVYCPDVLPQQADQIERGQRAIRNLHLDNLRQRKESRLLEQQIDSTSVSLPISPVGRPQTPPGLPPFRPLTPPLPPGVQQHNKPFTKVPTAFFTPNDENLAAKLNNCSAQHRQQDQGLSSEDQDSIGDISTVSTVTQGETAEVLKFSILVFSIVS